MGSARCVDKVKDALDINGVHGVHCDVLNQTVTVSGNLAPQTLLKKVKQVKIKSKILSYTSGFTITVRGQVGAPRHRRTTLAYGAPAYGSSAYTSSYYRSAGHLPPSSPPREYAYGSQQNQLALACPGSTVVYHSQYRPLQDYHTNY